MSGRFWLSGVTPVDSSGNPYALATIDWYIVGTTTREDVFTTGALSVAHSNPITLGADGRIPEIFLSQTRYKCVFKDSSGVTVSGLSYDGIDKSKQRVKSATAPSPTYAGLEWHDTATGDLKERNAANSDWVNRGPIDSIANAATITETLAGTATDKMPTCDAAAAIWEKGDDVVISTNNISLPSTGGGFHVCGTATTTLITISSRKAGFEVEIQFSNAQTITHGSGINTPSALDETITAGSRCRFRRNASDWDLTNVGLSVATQAAMETGTNMLAAVPPGRQHFHPLHPKFWAFVTVSAGTPTLAASHNVTSITDTGTGELTVTIATDFSSANWAPFVTHQRHATAASNSISMVGNAGQAAGTVLARCEDETASPAGIDPAAWSVMGLGDHA